MHAARYYGKEDIRIEDVTEPSVGPAEVKVDVEVAGICGTDLLEYRTGRMASYEPIQEQLPIIMGHEFAGIVADVGEDVTDVAVGDRVTVNPFTWCGECEHCRRGQYHYCEDTGSIGLNGGDGGFAESVVVPAITVVPLPDDLSLELGALVEPLAVAMSGVRDAGLQPGDTVAVFGAGPIGLGVVQGALAAGAGTLLVSEPQEARADIAAASGADAVIDPSDGEALDRIFAETDGRGVDVAFEVAGVEAALTDALFCTKQGGHVVTISQFEDAIEIHPQLLGGKTVSGSIGYEAGPRSRESFGRIINLIQKGRLEPERLITTRISLSNIVEGGFEPLAAGGDEVKVLVEP